MDYGLPRGLLSPKNRENTPKKAYYPQNDSGMAFWGYDLEGYPPNSVERGGVRGIVWYCRVP